VKAVHALLGLLLKRTRGRKCIDDNGVITSMQHIHENLNFIVLYIRQNHG